MNDISKISLDALLANKRFHSNLPDVPGKSAEEMKQFFDYLPKEILIPKINEIIEELLLKADSLTVDKMSESFNEALRQKVLELNSDFSTALENGIDGLKKYFNEEQLFQNADLQRNIENVSLNNSIYKTLMGKRIVLSDVHPIPYPLDIKIISNNVLDLSQANIRTYSKLCTIENNVIKNKATKGQYMALRSTGLENFLLVHRGEQFTFSVENSFGFKISVVFNGNFTDYDNTWIEFDTESGKNRLTFTVPENLETFSGNRFEIRLYNDTDVTNVTFENVMLNFGAEPLQYEIHKSSANSKLICDGKTLTQSEFFSNAIYAENGMILESDTDGTSVIVKYFLALSALNTEKDKLQKEVDIIKHKTSDMPEYNVPNYWLKSIVEKANVILSKIRTALYEGKEVITFFVRSDSHYPANSGVSPSLIKYLGDKCEIITLIELGDFIQDTASGEENKAILKTAVNQIKDSVDVFLLTQGNHDGGNQFDSAPLTAERQVYETEWKNIAVSKMLQNNLSFDKFGKAFFYDDYLQRVRFISLDAFEGSTYNSDGADNTGNFTDRQFAWFKEALNGTPEGFSVITFSHYSLFGFTLAANGENLPEITYERGILANNTQLTTALYNTINDFAKSEENLYNRKNRTYIGHFSGHTHYDFMQKKDAVQNIWVMNDGIARYTTPDKYKGYNELKDTTDKARYTLDECAFDVVVITKDTSGEVEITEGEIFRIGRSLETKNRTWRIEREKGVKNENV